MYDICAANKFCFFPIVFLWLHSAPTPDFTRSRHVGQQGGASFFAQKVQRLPREKGETTNRRKPGASPAGCRFSDRRQSPPQFTLSRCHTRANPACKMREPLLATYILCIPISGCMLLRDSAVQFSCNDQVRKIRFGSFALKFALHYSE